ncbi:MAG TPA: DUF971 domain-containing protein [Ignavibacteriaceae bacterium]|jgi:DUF971 family protein|nr:DUF971 domain-containing protein [Ignavibacteriaceae bacterium]
MTRPVKIKLKESIGLYIKWEDNTETSIPIDMLRRLCPCASCVIERERESKSYIPIFSRDQVTVTSIKSVGSYALAITWKDGHSTGIYEYSYLKILSLEKSAG